MAGDPYQSEEVDIVRIDPLFLERQRNRYASRGVAFLVILNGVAALLLLGNFVRLNPQIENAPKVADAMVVFGAGYAVALASIFFAYLRRTVMLRAPGGSPHCRLVGGLPCLPRRVEVMEPLALGVNAFIKIFLNFRVLIRLLTRTCPKGERPGVRANAS